MNQRSAKHLPLYLRPFLTDRIPSICVLPLIRICFSSLCSGHLLGDKGPFQRKRMAVHVNEDVLFTVEVGQTCALRSLKRTHKTLQLPRPNRQKLKCPSARFFLQNAVNRLFWGKILLVNIPRICRILVCSPISLKNSITGHF